MADIAKMIEEIKGMTVMELSQLVKAIEEEFGVSAAATAVAVSAGEAAPAAEEKSEYEVILKEIGETKMNVIKAVKEILGLGLKESKELVDAAPKTVKAGISKEEADEIEKKLKEAGATVEVK
ncbi:MAG: 50S ribosomal protein L7/L12 [Clostridiales bacterium]|nr:50S ribosomal protein L7/L12 [Clostridiales bacterium]